MKSRNLGSFINKVFTVIGIGVLIQLLLSPDETHALLMESEEYFKTIIAWSGVSSIITNSTIRLFEP